MSDFLSSAAFRRRVPGGPLLVQSEDTELHSQEGHLCNTTVTRENLTSQAPSNSSTEDLLAATVTHEATSIPLDAHSIEVITPDSEEVKTQIAAELESSPILIAGPPQEQTKELVATWIQARLENQPEIERNAFHEMVRSINLTRKEDNPMSRDQRIHLYNDLYMRTLRVASATNNPERYNGLVAEPEKETFSPDYVRKSGDPIIDKMDDLHSLSHPLNDRYDGWNQRCSLNYFVEKALFFFKRAQASVDSEDKEIWVQLAEKYAQAAELYWIDPRLSTKLSRTANETCFLFNAAALIKLAIITWDQRRNYELDLECFQKDKAILEREAPLLKIHQERIDSEEKNIKGQNRIIWNLQHEARDITRLPTNPTDVISVLIEALQCLHSEFNCLHNIALHEDTNSWISLAELYRNAAKAFMRVEQYVMPNARTLPDGVTIQQLYKDAIALQEQAEALDPTICSGPILK